MSGQHSLELYFSMRTWAPVFNLRIMSHVAFYASRFRQQIPNIQTRRARFGIRAGNLARSYLPSVSRLRTESRPLADLLICFVAERAIMSSNFGGQHPTHAIGQQIAANQGAVQYEDDSGKSLSGGSVPTTGQSIHNPVNGSGATGGYTGGSQFQGTNTLGSSSPNVTDVGLNTSGLVNAPAHQTTGATGSTSGPGAAGTSGGASASGTATTAGGSETLYDQASRGAQVAAAKAQELSEPIQPYIQKVQETVGPYVQTAVENASPYVQQAREAAAPLVEKASVLASQGIQATAAELDKRGVNVENIQQNLKDYGAAGQARAGEYFQQAVDQASTLRSDTENRNIVATVFGTIALIWLAFGFSITALLALGIAGGLAAILSRYSRAAVGPRSHTVGASSSAVPSQGSAASIPGVETHYPNRAHPDNSLNN